MTVDFLNSIVPSLFVTMFQLFMLIVPVVLLLRFTIGMTKTSI